jgi:hypothetical protein
MLEELSSDVRYSDGYDFADDSTSNWNGRKVLNEKSAHTAALPVTIPMIKQIVHEAVSITPHHRTPEFNPSYKVRYIELSPFMCISPIDRPQHTPNTAGAMIGSDNLQNS